MSATRTTDLVIPAIFSPATIERATELSEIVQSEAVVRAGFFDSLCNGPGATYNMPYLKEVTGSSEVISDTGGSLTVNPVTEDKDIAPALNRGKAWGENDLARWASGADPVGSIRDFVAGFWARDAKQIMLKILDGLFDNTNGVLRTTHRVNIYNDVVAGSITDAMRLTGDTFVDGTLKLGDFSPTIRAVLVHSDIEGYWRKKQLIAYVQPAGAVGARIPTFQDRRVMVSDDCPKVAGANSPSYTSYLFGVGSFALGYQTNDPERATEIQRVGLASETYLITRRRMLLHPLGVKWSGSAAAAGGPTNTELATGTNWTKVYQDKNIHIVAIKHNL